MNERIDKLAPRDGAEDLKGEPMVVALAIFRKLGNGDVIRRAGTALIPVGGGFTAEVDRLSRNMHAAVDHLIAMTRESGWKSTETVPNALPEDLDALPGDEDPYPDGNYTGQDAEDVDGTDPFTSDDTFST